MKTLSLDEYCRDDDRRNALIRGLGTSYASLWQVRTGWRGQKVSPARAVAIEVLTDGVVPRWRTRPDLWAEPK